MVNPVQSVGIRQDVDGKGKDMIHTHFYLAGLALLAIASMVKKTSKVHKFAQIYLVVLLAVSAVTI